MNTHRQSGALRHIDLQNTDDAEIGGIDGVLLILQSSMPRFRKIVSRLPSAGHRQPLSGRRHGIRQIVVTTSVQNAAKCSCALVRPSYDVPLDQIDQGVLELGDEAVSHATILCDRAPCRSGAYRQRLSRE